MKLRIAAFLLAGLLTAPALAEPVDTNYVGAQFAQATYDESDFEDVNPTALVGRFGHFVHESFSLEGRFGVGLAEDSLTWDGMELAAEIDHVLGIYGVGHLPLSNGFSLYGLAGFTQGKMTFTARYMGMTASESGSDSGFSYGVGGQVNLSPTAGLTLEYVSYLDKSDYQLSAVSAGLNFMF